MLRQTTHTDILIHIIILGRIHASSLLFGNFTLHLKVSPN